MFTLRIYIKTEFEITASKNKTQHKHKLPIAVIKEDYTPEVKKCRGLFKSVLRLVIIRVFTPILQD